MLIDDRAICAENYHNNKRNALGECGIIVNNWRFLLFQTIFVIQVLKDIIDVV